MADPVADGLVASLARPEGNITGTTFLGPELQPKRLQLLREVIPGAKRIAALQHPAVYSEATDRGRNASFPAPPAQIRASPIQALGSHLGYLPKKRSLGQGCKMRTFGNRLEANLAIVAQVVRSF
jgi:hypothetical protein